MKKENNFKYYATAIVIALFALFGILYSLAEYAVAYHFICKWW